MSDLTHGLSIGDIAKTLGQDRERIRYLVLRDRIEPLCRVGRTRVFSESALESIRHACRRLDAEQNGTLARAY